MQNAVHCALLGPALWAGSTFPAAAKKLASTPESDRIDVIAHLPLSGAPVVHLTADNHWRRDYLYVDQGSSSPVTILDVTNPAAPQPAGQLDIPKQEANGNLSAVVGTTALVASPASAPTRQTVTIMSFADPEHPKIEQHFAGVTAMLKQGSLVYLANAQGLWVLRMTPATDEALKEQYQNYVLYNR